jgi:SAM-dependent methyltransferase
VLSIGGAYGHELLPLLGRINEVTIVEPSDAFVASRLGDTTIRYVKPASSGLMPFADASFDLVCALSVLHHIPNVSVVLGEMHRCLKPGGWALLREPTTSMGDWRRPRRGLTRNERGLPLEWFRRAVMGAGFQVVRETRCMNAVTPRLGKALRRGAYNSEFLVTLDSVLTRLISWNRTYHAVTILQRVRSWAVAYVLRRPGPA